MTKQAQVAQKRMRAAGFAASEFRVETDRSRRWAPGQVLITVRSVPTAELLQRVPAILAHGLDVVVYTSGRFLVAGEVELGREGEGKLFLVNCNGKPGRQPRVRIADLASMTIERKADQ